MVLKSLWWLQLPTCSRWISSQTLDISSEIIAMYCCIPDVSEKCLLDPTTLLVAWSYNFNTLFSFRIFLFYLFVFCENGAEGVCTLFLCFTKPQAVKLSFTITSPHTRKKSCRLLGDTKLSFLINILWTKQDNKVIISASCALTSLFGGTIQAQSIVQTNINTL